MKYEVNFKDWFTGAESPIDVIEADENYTVNDYVKDCETNADNNWVDMLHNGTVTLVPIPEHIRATKIMWNTDEDIIDGSLPDYVDIPDGIEEDDIADYLSDTYEFCVFGFDIEKYI